MNAQTLLCLDFGEKRIGVAVGQALTRTATPLETIAVRHGRPDWDRLARLVESWQPGAIVVGNPVNMDGSRQKVTASADRFARRVAGRFNLPVYRADERLSTFEARLRNRRGGHDDAIAAQVILESWLEAEGRSGPPT